MPGDLSKSLVCLLLLESFVCAGKIPAQENLLVRQDLLSAVQDLYAREQWDSILQVVPTSRFLTPELDYYRGMALARMGRWVEARRSLEEGEKKAPFDKRFSLELAGVSFKLQDFSRAKRHLRRALKLDIQDTYGNDFLASVYFLEGNLEAALKYWNRVSKPFIVEVNVEPQPRLRPVLLDRAFAFSPSNLLQAGDLLATQARLKQLEIFSHSRFELLPRADERFDLIFRSVERNGWGNSRIEGLFSTFRDIPAQMIHLEFFNLQQSALNSISFYRWDAQKRRVFTSLSGAWRGDPKWRYRFNFDGRKENWDLSRSLPIPQMSVGDLRLRKMAGGAEIEARPNGRWGWKTGVELSDRRFSNIPLQVPDPEKLFPDGASLKYLVSVDHRLIEVPERRFWGQSFCALEVARLFTPPHNSFAKIQAGVRSTWKPQARGDDYSVTTQFRAGGTKGASPFDELFVLGLERDNDLWARGHVATHDGKRGSGFLGRNYLLFNWELDKLLYHHAFFDVMIGPFLDSGKIVGKTNEFSSPYWLWDTGGQLKVRVLGGPTLVLSYGKDLQTGRNAFYATYAP